MRTPLASLDALVHPHQIEVQEFSSYALVIDARSPEAFQADHIPGAVNVPVGTPDRERHRLDTEFTGVRDVEAAVPYLLTAHTRTLRPGAPVLVYCDRGGLDSLVWASALASAGLVVDVLPGGWNNYRRWVTAGLDVVARALEFRLLVAPPVSGLSRIAAHLARRGQQVLDLTALAGQRLVPGLTLTGDVPPSQAAFETALLAAMRHFSPQRPVWVRVSLCGLGSLSLPDSLRDGLARSGGARLEVTLSARAHAWKDCLAYKGVSTEHLLGSIASSEPCDPELVARWLGLAASGRLVDALAQIISVYIDPRVEATEWARAPDVFVLESLAPEAVDRLMDRWLERAGR